MKPINLLFAAAEMTPIAKAGGLGDVIGALPKELYRRVNQLMIALPFYDLIPREQLRQLKHIGQVTVHLGQQRIVVTVWKAQLIGTHLNLLLFKQADYLSQGKIYEGKVPDPLTKQICLKEAVGGCLRQMVFCYAIYEWLRLHPNHFSIVHVHDHHVSPLLPLLKHDQTLAHIKTVLTIHNLFYNGSLLKPYWEVFVPNLFPLFSKVEAARPKGPRMLWLGIEWADAITTVSPQYAKDILTPEYGCELELTLVRNVRKLSPILNGIDTDVINPTTDKILHTRFSRTSLQRRLRNKAFLQKQCRLPLHPEVPIVGMVTRLVAHKGVELILNSIEELSSMQAQFVICGTGPKHYIKALQEAAKRHPHKWHIHNSFDTVFSQYVYAGSDIFLMPSRHEPCGLSQLIAMRYGSVPLVRATGGLKDTVTDGYNGFVFNKYSSQTMLLTLKRALKVYRTDRTKWKKLVDHGMAGDYGWKESATAYTQLYQSLLHVKK